MEVPYNEGNKGKNQERGRKNRKQLTIPKQQVSKIDSRWVDRQTDLVN